MWDASYVSHPLTGLTPGAVYRIDLDARAPQGASAALLADLFGAWDDRAMIVDPEHIGRDWRHHQWTFRLPDSLPAGLNFRLLSYGETPIEVRRVSLHRADWPTPINLGNRLEAGGRVYEEVGELRPLRPGGSRVHVYENRLWRPRSFEVESVRPFSDNESLIEDLRWRPEAYDLTREALVVDAGRTHGEGPLIFTSERAAGPAVPAIANGLGHLNRYAASPTVSFRQLWWFLPPLGLAAWWLAWRVVRRKTPYS
jgi:hypothetical protein